MDESSSVHLLSVKTQNNNLNHVSDNNNMLESHTFEPFDLEFKPDTLGHPAKKRSRLLYVVAWTFIGCAIVLLIAAVAIVIKFSVKSGGETGLNATTVIPNRSTSSAVPTPSTTPLPSINTTVSSSVSPNISSSTTSSTTSTTTISTSTVKSTTPLSVCKSGEFRCMNGECIPATQVCDGTAHCLTADDEFNCPCSDDQYRCNSGECINKEHRCDMDTQCKDSSDEMNCTNCNGFQCTSGLCLWTSTVKCNGHVDCPDLSDETNCFLRPGYKSCANGMSVPRDKFCDGVDDCFDNSDETDPECQQPDMCHFLFERPCASGGCYLMDWQCDGHNDCADMTDEKNCGTCETSEFQCLDYKCIPADQVCDGIQQCTSGDDEVDCIQMTIRLSGTLTFNSGDMQLPVCSDSWSKSLADGICEHLGHGASSTSSFETYETAGVKEGNGFMMAQPKATLTQDETILANFVKTSTCPSRKVVNLNCQPETCGKRQVDALVPYIVGGLLPPLGKWPWVVSLSQLGSNICGGVIVGDRWVLTAGHCIVQQDQNYTLMPQQFEVLAGTVSRDRHTEDQYQLIRVDKIYLNPNLKQLHNGQIAWDMALLHLSAPLKFGDYVQPICLQTDDGPEVIPSQCYLAGWGFINQQFKTVTDLRDGKLTLFDDEKCSRSTNTGTPVNTNYTVCAGYAYGLISGCRGDSGSPLMCMDTLGHWSVTGLMSYGIGGCDGGANRFSRISTSVDWIQNTINSR